MFQHSGANYFPTKEEDLSLVKELPLAVYEIMTHPVTGALYLHKQQDIFPLLPKYYGEFEEIGDRILKTYSLREVNTGVLLIGQKGTGKSLMARYVSSKAGVPVIVVSSPFAGQSLQDLFSAIEGRAVVLFDEFDKNFPDSKPTSRPGYNEENTAANAQEQLLSIMDGTMIGKKLFIMTANNRFKINEFLLNRPGRVLYNIKFHGLDDLSIQQYCEDKLNDKSMIQSVINSSRPFSMFTFDMLKGLVEEMNRYNESPGKAMRLLNIDVDFDGSVEYDFKVLVNGNEIGSGSCKCKITLNLALSFERTDVGRGAYIKSNPSTVVFDDWGEPDEESIPEESRRTMFFNHEFSPDMITKMDGDEVTYTHVVGKNTIVAVLKRKVERHAFGYGY